MVFSPVLRTRPSNVILPSPRRLLHSTIVMSGGFFFLSAPESVRTRIAVRMTARFMFLQCITDEGYLYRRIQAAQLGGERGALQAQHFRRHLLVPAGLMQSLLQNAALDVADGLFEIQATVRKRDGGGERVGKRDDAPVRPGSGKSPG